MAISMHLEMTSRIEWKRDCSENSTYDNYL